MNEIKRSAGVAVGAWIILSVLAFACGGCVILVIMGL
jgi:hypothetical protein